MTVILKAKQLHALVSAANANLQAALLLGLNCAYINVDCCRLTLAAAKEAVATGWLGGKRQKTGVKRMAALWPETKQALQGVIDSHPGNNEALFLTPNGHPWRSSPNDSISRELKKLTSVLGVAITFARLRHHFATIAEERTLDSVAIRHVMAHSDHSISAVYRDRILKKRIFKVCKAVRTWYLKGRPTV